MYDRIVRHLRLEVSLRIVANVMPPRLSASGKDEPSDDGGESGEIPGNRSPTGWRIDPQILDILPMIPSHGLRKARKDLLAHYEKHGTFEWWAMETQSAAAGKGKVVEGTATSPPHAQCKVKKKGKMEQGMAAGRISSSSSSKAKKKHGDKKGGRFVAVARV